MQVIQVCCSFAESEPQLLLHNLLLDTRGLQMPLEHLDDGRRCWTRHASLPSPYHCKVMYTTSKVSQWYLHQSDAKTLVSDASKNCLGAPPHHLTPVHVHLHIARLGPACPPLGWAYNGATHSRQKERSTMQRATREEDGRGARMNMVAFLYTASVGIAAFQ